MLFCFWKSYWTHSPSARVTMGSSSSVSQSLPAQIDRRRSPSGFVPSFFVRQGRRQQEAVELSGHKFPRERPTNGQGHNCWCFRRAWHRQRSWEPPGASPLQRCQSSGAVRFRRHSVRPPAADRQQYAVSVFRFGSFDRGARQPHQRAQQSIPLTLCIGNGSRKRVIHRNLQDLVCRKNTTKSPEREGEKFFFLQKGTAS